MKSWGMKLFSILGIIVLGIIVYSNTFFSSFHFDDDLYIINDYAIRNIQHLNDIWKICPCRFLTFLTLALNYHYNHLEVFGYHVFNIVVHLLSACFVWWLVLMTFSTPAMKEEKIAKHAQVISLLAALIFVSHPIQIEAVTYIWQRTASLAALFYLASLCFYIKFRIGQAGNGKACQSNTKFYYYISIGFAVLAMFTKENTITLPLMILFYEISFFKTSIKSLNWDYLFPFMMTLFIIPETMFLTGSARFFEIKSIVGGHEGITPMHYLFTQFRVMFTYIRLAFLPFNLNIDYEYPVFKSFFEIPVIISFSILVVIFYFAKRIFAKYRLVSFSIGWFFLTLLPESSILPQEDVIFEHRLYLPLVGYCIFLVSGFYYLYISHSERSEESKGILRSFVSLRMTVWVILMIIACNSFLTYQRNQIWKNEITLWEDTVQKSPHKARVYNNRGWAYYNQGDFLKAMQDFNQAIHINPEYVFSYDDRGLIYAKEGRFSAAIAEYDKAIELNPYYPMIYFNRAQSFLEQKKYDQARSDYNKAIELNPLYVDAFKEGDKLYAKQRNK